MRTLNKHMEINFAEIEKKWQDRWASEKTFEVIENDKKKKYYILEMFPYPSGTGLHMGHAFNYTIGDILARFKIMNGFNVLHPMGYDALGLPAENAAIKVGTHPEKYTNDAIINYMKQQKALGTSYDWSRVINTASPEYYRWDQWIFLKMLEKGLAYQKTSAVNWCPECNTVLANEQVENGKCWRHENTEVEIKHLKQWFFKTTEYANELYENLDNMNWPERTKAMQKNWIGKSHGTEIDFEIENSEDKISNVVIIHGSSAKDKEKLAAGYPKQNKRNWIPWTKEKLEKLGFAVETPLMPENWNPNYEEWKNELEKIKIDENSILIGTSAGGTFLTRWLGETDIKIKKLILIAPACRTGKEGWENQEFYDFDINKNILDKTNNIILIESDNDSAAILNSCKIYSKKLNLTSIVLKNKGHFTSYGMGTNEFPELLEEIIKEDKEQVVLVHGSNSTKKESVEGLPENERHWKMWLKKKLEKRGFSVSNELYPQDWNPNYEEWKKVFEKNKINKNAILVGHSAGCAFILRWLSEKKIKVKKVILIAPYILDNSKMSHLSKLVDFKIEDNLESYIGELDIFYANNDNDCIIKSAKLANKKLGGNLINLKGRGHFCKGDGVIEFPELLEEITNKTAWPIFTTRPDTIFGVTFMVVSAQHSRLNELVTPEQKDDVDKFLKKLKSVSEKDVGDLEKEGVFTGSYAINPANRERIPIWIGNFVVADYGSGMVMAVPAHDKRDFEFAKKYGIEIKEVVAGNAKNNSAYTGSGKLINSEKFNGIENQEAKEKITNWLIEKGTARKVTNFKLRDWGISRQRYWGTPIPIIYCDKCGVVPIPEKDLPVKLPKDVKFGEGNPLETATDWVKTICPKCGCDGKRETDTMDTFVNSSWYFLRYCDPKNDKEIFDKEKTNYWCPIDTYIGGAEHACMHLIYSRFYVKFLRDLGLINFDEPAIRLFHQGMLHAEDGRKMSKSLGNVIDPLETAKQYGVDAVRFFIVSVASPDKDFDWSEKEMVGSLKFLKKIINTYENIEIGTDSDEVLSLLNLSIRDTKKQFDNFDYRSATIRLRSLFDLLSTQKEASKETLEKSLKILNPICPHITEELWEKLGNANLISISEWPKSDNSKIRERGHIGNLNEKIADTIKYILNKTKTAENIYTYLIPFEFERIDKSEIEKLVGKRVSIFAVNDKKKYDPKKMAKKAKPGKPSVYLE